MIPHSRRSWLQLLLIRMSRGFIFSNTAQTRLLVHIVSKSKRPYNHNFTTLFEGSRYASDMSQLSFVLVYRPYFAFINYDWNQRKNCEYCSVKNTNVRWKCFTWTLSRSTIFQLNRVSRTLLIPSRSWFTACSSSDSGPRSARGCALRPLGPLMLWLQFHEINIFVFALLYQ